MTLKPTHIFSFFSMAFFAFSLSIYLKPVFASPAASVQRPKAAEGRLIWQKYGCQNCHQLYGLGGYLGPDLTNVFSAPGKGEPWVRAFIRSGLVPMPAFDMSEEETVQLIEFLKETDASGKADPRSFTIESNGMTQRK